MSEVTETQKVEVVVVDKMAIQAQDRAKLNTLRSHLKNGGSLVVEDLIFNTVQSSELTSIVIEALKRGAKFVELKGIGLTDNQAISVLSYFNAQLDAEKYEVELALRKLAEKPELLTVFFAQLVNHNVELPKLDGLFATMRSNSTICAELAIWSNK